MPSSQRRAAAASLFSSLPPDLKRSLRTQAFQSLEVESTLAGPSKAELFQKGKWRKKGEGSNPSATPSTIAPSITVDRAKLIGTQPDWRLDEEEDGKDQARNSRAGAIDQVGSVENGDLRLSAEAESSNSGRRAKKPRQSSPSDEQAVQQIAAFVKPPAEASTIELQISREKLDTKNVSNGKGKQRAKDVINVGSGHPWNVTGLVDRYEKWDDVPHEVRKYFAQRLSLFSRYDSHNILMDTPTGWFSVTPENVAAHIADRCTCDTVLDGFAGVGGNAIQFARTCERVIAIDKDMTRLQLARHNAMQYGVADRIEFICADFIEFVDSYARRKPGREDVDVVFLSPPWGGSEYLTQGIQGAGGSSAFPFDESVQSAQTYYPLSALSPVSGQELFRLASLVSPNIAFFLPRNIDVKEVADLAPLVPDESRQSADPAREWVEVEEEWMIDGRNGTGGNKKRKSSRRGGGGSHEASRLKAVTAYFGALVSEGDGQF